MSTPAPSSSPENKLAFSCWRRQSQPGCGLSCPILSRKLARVLLLTVPVPNWLWHILSHPLQKTSQGSPAYGTSPNLVVAYLVPSSPENKPWSSCLRCQSPPDCGISCPILSRKLARVLLPTVPVTAWLWYIVSHPVLSPLAAAPRLMPRPIRLLIVSLPSASCKRFQGGWGSNRGSGHLVPRG